MENILVALIVLVALWIVLGAALELIGFAVAVALAIAEGVIEARRRRALERQSATDREGRGAIPNALVAATAPSCPDLEGGASMLQEQPDAVSQRDVESAILATLIRQMTQAAASLRWLILSRLREEDFRSDEHRALYRALVELDRRGCLLSAEAFLDLYGIDRAKELGRTLKAVRRRGTVIDDPALLQRCVEMLVLPARLGQAKTLVAEVAEELERATASGDLEACRTAIETIQTIAFDLGRVGAITGEAGPEGELIQHDLARAIASSEDPRTVRVWPTFSHLDHVVGGLRPGLHVLAGQPGCGKSAYLRQLCDVVCERNRAPVLYFSFESSAGELRAGTLAWSAGVRTRRGALQVPVGRQWKPAPEWLAEPASPKALGWTPHHLRVSRLMQRMGWMHRRFHTIEATLDTTVSKIEVLVRTALRREESERLLVVIDSLNAMPLEPGHSAGSRAELAELASRLRRMARGLGVPVVAAARATCSSRAASRKPDAAALEDLGGVVDAANVVGLFWTDPEETRHLRARREYLKDQQPSEVLAQRRGVSLCILKNHAGPTAEIRMLHEPTDAFFQERDVLPLDYLDVSSGR